MEDNKVTTFELTPNTILGVAKYMINCVIGVNSYGITYKANHTDTNKSECIIMEFFPENQCFRSMGVNSIQLNEGVEKEVFEKMRQKFVDDAQTLAKFKHENIIEILDIFDENDTSYVIASYVEGLSWQALSEKYNAHLTAFTQNYQQQMKSLRHDYLKVNGVSNEIKLPRSYYVITPENKAILVGFASVQVFSTNKIQDNIKFVENTSKKSDSLQSSSKPKEIDILDATPKQSYHISPITKNVIYDVTVDKKSKENERATQSNNKQRALAALACSTCKRPLPICICQRMKQEKKVKNISNIK